MHFAAHYSYLKFKAQKHAATLTQQHTALLSQLEAKTQMKLFLSNVTHIMLGASMTKLFGN